MNDTNVRTNSFFNDCGMVWRRLTGAQPSQNHSAEQNIGAGAIIAQGQRDANGAAVINLQGKSIVKIDESQSAQHGRSYKVLSGKEKPSWMHNIPSFDQIMHASCCVSVAFGAGIILYQDDPDFFFEGIAVSGALTSICCIIWSVGCLIKGEPKKAAKRLAVFAALAKMSQVSLNIKFASPKFETTNFSLGHYALKSMTRFLDSGASGVKNLALDITALDDQIKAANQELDQLIQSNGKLLDTMHGRSDCYNLLMLCQQDHEDLQSRNFVAKIFNAKPNLSLEQRELYEQNIQERVNQRISQKEWVANELIEAVQVILQSGGKVIQHPRMGSSGSYLIVDSGGRTKAIFKPDDEVVWSPNNPNPLFRKPQLSDEDIYFHQVNSFEQGKKAERQFLAELVHVGYSINVPTGAITTLTSDQFFHSSGEVRVQTKRGYLQAWLEDVTPLSMYHPSVDKNRNEPLPIAAEQHFHDNPMLDQISLDQFQELAINDILIYNEDRHAENILISHKKNNQIEVATIDHDAIMPWKLKSLHSIFSHSRTDMPFTSTALEMIESIDPDFIAAMVERMNLFEQAPINAKILAMVVKRVAKAGGTLRDIERFVSFGDRHNMDGISRLGKLIDEAKQAAIDNLTDEDRKAYLHEQYLRRTMWCETMDEKWCKPLPVDQREGTFEWRKQYNIKKSQKINHHLKVYFWEEIEWRLDEVLPIPRERETL